jgi:hypothetical protein
MGSMIHMIHHQIGWPTVTLVSKTYMLKMEIIPQPKSQEYLTDHADFIAASNGWSVGEIGSSPPNTSKHIQYTLHTCNIM